MSASALAHPVALSPEPAVARRQLVELLGEAGWPEMQIDGVVLAVHEALVNAHRHGGGLHRARAGFDGGSLVVEVCDRGEGFTLPESEPAPERQAERGRGLFLMGRLATCLEVGRRGEEVCLTMRFEP